MNGYFFKSFLTVAIALFGAIGAATAQLPPPGLPSPQGGPSARQGSSAGSQTQTPTAPQPQSAFAGSVPGKLVPGILPITLQDAIDRGLKQNLGALLSSQDVQAARGKRWQELSALLPHVTASPLVDVSQVNLKEFGFNFNFPGVNVPSVVGPFSYFDARAFLNQQLFDWKAINKTRSATESVKSAQYSYKDARDLVVLAVGYNYLQAIADEARIETAAAQVKTAQALYDQANDRFNAGTSPSIDPLRTKVELQTRQQQLIQAKNDLAIQKLTVARVIGLAPGQQYELTDKSPYAPLESITPDEAIARAYAARSDYQAALADVRATEFSRKAAAAGYLPSVSFAADYGVAGQHASSNHGVFDVRGTVNIPIFQGGSVHGDVLDADARLQQSRDRMENLRAQIDTDVRTALLNLESSAQQVEVARSNIDLAGQTLTQSIDRFAAGVTDSVEVVQSQEAVASANEQYISSLYNYNYSKISLARAIGQAEEGVKQYFKGK
ncbi:MAG: TolC family protein [Candidatus Acidiferrales bacterium]